ncbi:MAG: hypothetical protein H6Q59_1123 [Firmicutes bacterium]|nr:hypothetical protein [Bacillota bacterium]
MKTWNTPEISELNINETANGRFDFFVEFWVLNDDILDSFKCTPSDPVNEHS